MTFLRVSISTTQPSQVLLLLPIIHHIVIMAAFHPRSVCVCALVRVSLRICVKGVDVSAAPVVSDRAEALCKCIAV